MTDQSLLDESEQFGTLALKIVRQHTILTGCIKFSNLV